MPGKWSERYTSEEDAVILTVIRAKGFKDQKDAIKSIKDKFPHRTFDSLYCRARMLRGEEVRSINPIEVYKEVSPWKELPHKPVILPCLARPLWFNDKEELEARLTSGR